MKQGKPNRKRKREEPNPADDVDGESDVADVSDDDRRMEDSPDQRRDRSRSPVERAARRGRREQQNQRRYSRSFSRSRTRSNSPTPQYKREQAKAADDAEKAKAADDVDEAKAADDVGDSGDVSDGSEERPAKRARLQSAALHFALQAEEHGTEEDRLSAWRVYASFVKRDPEQARLAAEAASLQMNDRNGTNEGNSADFDEDEDEDDIEEDQHMRRLQPKRKNPAARQPKPHNDAKAPVLPPGIHLPQAARERAFRDRRQLGETAARDLVDGRPNLDPNAAEGFAIKQEDIDMVDHDGATPVGFAEPRAPPADEEKAEEKAEQMSWLKRTQQAMPLAKREVLRGYDYRLRHYAGEFFKNYQYTKLINFPGASVIADLPHNVKVDYFIQRTLRDATTRKLTQRQVDCRTHAIVCSVFNALLHEEVFSNFWTDSDEIMSLIFMRLGIEIKSTPLRFGNLLNEEAFSAAVKDGQLSAALFEAYRKFQTDAAARRDADEQCRKQLPSADFTSAEKEMYDMASEQAVHVERGLFGITIFREIAMVCKQLEPGDTRLELAIAADVIHDAKDWIRNITVGWFHERLRKEYGKSCRKEYNKRWRNGDDMPPFDEFLGQPERWQIPHFDDWLGQYHSNSYEMYQLRRETPFTDDVKSTMDAFAIQWIRFWIDREWAPLVDNLILAWSWRLGSEKLFRIHDLDDYEFDKFIGDWHERMMEYVRYAYFLRFQYSLGYDKVSAKDAYSRCLVPLLKKHFFPASFDPIRNEPWFREHRRFFHLADANGAAFSPWTMPNGDHSEHIVATELNKYPRPQVLAQPAPPIAQAAPPIAQPREQQGARQNARDGGNLMANGCFNFGDVQLHAHAADRARAPQQSIDEQFRARFGNYRNRHPFPQSHRNRHFGNYAVDPYRSRGNSHGPPAPYYPPAPAPPPGPAPPGPAPAPAVVAGGGNRPAQAVIDEDAIYSRAAHARRSSPNRDDADAAFAREAGSAARDAHDRLGGQLPRGYF